MIKQSTETLSLFKKENEENKQLNKLAKPDKKAEAYWNKCLDIIEDNVSPQVYKTWFKPINAYKWDDNQLTIQVPSQFVFEWIEEHYYDLLQKAIKHVLGENAKLLYEVLVSESNDDLEKRAIRIPAFRHAPSIENEAKASENGNYKSVKRPESNLNSRYTFRNFIKGDSNQLAYSAGEAISNNPGGTRYNPLVIYGDTGLGKTHLVQAIGNEILRNDKSLAVHYTDSNRFTMEFIQAIQNNKQSEFINSYRHIDVLIVDDIQFFAGKEKTQDNFFHTFNALHQTGKQLILTSDRPPKELSDVDDRLISRFQWGLTVDIQKPDLETRMAILQIKSTDEGFELPTDIIEYIARNVTSSIRELEGVLISILAKTTLDKRELSLGLAKEVVRGVAFKEPKPLTIVDIKETVSEYYKIPIDIIESKSRKHEIALARQMCMYLAKQLTNLSLKSIGANFGNRDHSTVLHSCQTIENYLVTDRKVKGSFETLLKSLTQG